MTTHRLTVNIRKKLVGFNPKLSFKMHISKNKKEIIREGKEILEENKISLLQNLMTAVFPKKGAIMSNAADQSNKMGAELTHSLDNMEINSDLAFTGRSRCSFSEH